MRDSMLGERVLATTVFKQSQSFSVLFDESLTSFQEDPPPLSHELM
jgi:hypothetical protein